MKQEFITVREISKELGQMSTTIYLSLWSGKLVGHQDESGRWKIRREDFEQFREKRRKRKETLQEI